MSIEIDMDDKSWLTNCFLINPKVTKEPSLLKKVVDSARYKCIDTTPGGNIYHNPAPQWCRNGDPKRGGLGGSKGVGSGWSELQDDTVSLIHMRPGITVFNSMTRFFTKGLSPKVNYMMKTGEVPGLVFNIGKGLGYVTSIPFLPFTIFGQALDYAIDKPQTKFAYLKHTPALYYSAASNIFNTLTAYTGVSAPSTLNAKGGNIVVEPLDTQEKSQFHLMLPEIIDEDGKMDLFAIATRARKLTAARAAQMEADLTAATTEKQFYEATLGIDSNGDVKTPAKLSGAHQNLTDMLAAYASTSGQWRQGQVDPETGKVLEAKPAGYFDELQASFMARFHNGLDWVSFAYDGEKTSSYGFTNNVGESVLEGKLKGLTSGANDAVFSFAGGNLGEGMIASTIEGGLGLVKDAVNGFLSGVGMGGLVSLGGAAYSDLPQQWKESTSELPGFNLSINLRSWSGHPMNITKRIHLPLSLLLPFMLPRSTGNSTFTSPFAMEYFAKGHSQSRYAMCVGGSIELGEDQGGWTISHLARTATVNLQIADLNSVVHMPVGAGLDIGETIDSLFSDETSLNSFLSAVGGLSYESQNSVNRMKMFNLRKHLAGRRLADAVNPSKIGMELAESTPTRVVRAAYHAWTNL